MRLALLRAPILALVVATGAHAAPWDLPPLDPVLNYQPRQHLQVFTADGVEIGAFGTERRFFVPIARIPKRLQDAVIAVEDARFRAVTKTRAIYDQYPQGSVMCIKNITQGFEAA